MPASYLRCYGDAVLVAAPASASTPKIIARTCAAAKNELEMPEREVVKTITEFASVSDKAAAG